MFKEKVRALAQAFLGALGIKHKESVSPLKGELFITVRDVASGDVIEERHFKNLIVLDASILVARLIANNTEPPHGLFVLAVGTGDVGWNPLAPPAPTNTQRALYAEITRKTFASVQFVDAGGVPVAYPTKTVDFTTTFTESEAVGPLVEMGLIGGNISTNMAVKNPVSPPNGPYDPTVDLTAFETLFNYITFPVISKPPTATLTITWRISCLYCVQVMVKVCTKCQQEKSLELFVLNKRRSDGHGSWCKTCNRSYMSDLIRRPDQQARRKHYYETHKSEARSLNKVRWEERGYLYEPKRKAWAEANRDKMLAYYVERRKKTRHILDQVKTQPCVDCGNVYPTECMDFDHVRGAKKAGISNMASHSRDRVLEELAKCDLVCSNCHRTRTVLRAQKGVELWQKISVLFRASTLTLLNGPLKPLFSKPTSPL